MAFVYTIRFVEVATVDQVRLNLIESAVGPQYIWYRDMSIFRLILFKKCDHDP